VVRSRYTIVVGGELSARLGEAVSGWTVRAAGGRTVLQGEVCDQAALHGLLARLQSFGVELLSVNPSAADRRGDDSVPSETLTGREGEVLVLLAGPLSRREIASTLGISPNTAASHVKSIYRKLGVSSRERAVERGLALGLLGEGDSAVTLVERTA
jgi:DNA-binding CsgD family transcriptional regulator